MCADVISGRYPIPRPLTLTLTHDLENQNKGHFRVQGPKLDLGKKFKGNLNPSLNRSLSTSLTSRTLWHLNILAVCNQISDFSDVFHFQM